MLSEAFLWQNFNEKFRKKITKNGAELGPFWHSYHLRAETVNNIAITKIEKDIEFDGSNN